MKNTKKKILYISCSAPYDSVDHAGGKVHNYYLKCMHATGKFDITLLSMCWERERKFLDLNDYGIKNVIYILDKNIYHKLLRMIISGFSYFNPFDKYANLLLDYERYQYKKLIRNYIKLINSEVEKTPEIIILQWTQMIFLVNYIKKKFPESKIIAIEEDVSFLNFFRRINLSHNRLIRNIEIFRYNKIKKLELSVLNKADLIVNNNHKDLVLLLNNNIPIKKLYELPIYFDRYNNVQRLKVNNGILFYGAMSRPENYNSAIWFIDEVMPLLIELNCRFIIVGSRPDKKLLERQNDRIIVTGFVETIEKYFQNCRCMVAPLTLGAGVKVKILEAMSSGIPVLTNDIGIEGINASTGKEYILCRTPEEYAVTIKQIFDMEGAVSNEVAKKFVCDNYNLDKRFREFMDNELG